MSVAVDRMKLANRLGVAFNGERNYYKVFGYKQELTISDYINMYDRNPIAQRVIKAYPQATWRDMPHIESEDTVFEQEFHKIWNTHKLTNYFERADRLASIGEYGVLFMGFQDGKEPKEPLEKGSYSLLFLSPFSQDKIQIEKLDLDLQSVRYGMPLLYKVKTGNKGTELLIHHSRVIHIAENLNDSEVFGTPRLQGVYNNLVDLEKVMGASAEMFFKGAKRTFSLEAKDDYSVDNAEELKEQADEFAHNLRDFFTLEGMEAKMFRGDYPDPSSNFNVQLDVIAGNQAIPKRILLGSEAGQLASSQDETNWNSRVDERRMSFAAPKMVRPFVDAMMLTGNLPTLEDYTIEWDESASLSELDIAQIQESRSRTIDNLDRAGVASLETKLKVLHPDWDDKAIKDEMAKIRDEGVGIIGS